jgi:acetyl esterase/lipase
MGDLSRAQEVEQQFHHLVQSESYTEALDLITHEAFIFPEHAQKVVYYWRMAMACRLNDKDLALHLLKEAVQAGYWYAGLETDPDFRVLYGEAEFAHLAKIGMEHRAQAMANAVPITKILQPDSKFSPYPLLLALHGSNANVEIQVKHWASAVQHGWFVALPQSSQLFAPGTYTWNDWEWAQQEVCERYTSLYQEYPIDAERVVLAGFSQGGGLALWLVLSGAIKAQGLVLVGPFLDEITQIIPFLEKHVPYGLRVYLVAGQRDRYCYGIAQQLAILLPKYGIVCKLDDYPDLEHSFPIDFEKNYPRRCALCYLSEIYTTVRLLFQTMRPKIAYTRLVGVAAFSGSLRGLKLVPSR